MRRAEKEIADPIAIEDIIRRATVCHLAMIDPDGCPYLVPLCFGYERGALFFHTAAEGHKIDAIRVNPNVCFEFDVDVEVAPAAEPCQCGMRYRSVIGFGRAEWIEGLDEKRAALGTIMRQYGAQTASFSTSSLERTVVFRVDIDRLTGKSSGYR